ncbi:universal stress protein [Conchiformibius steedae]|uniref:Universal stress protein n=1 Tax=Conchiformibius steedae TaxID=153493 RepID=A0A3P2A3R8_9NEIS|nr:universal stress protein [Conchiformibius steedae]RRD89625.1 universal stress protein [Conchiformibius steedae]
MYQHIVVAVDGSNTALKALEHACRLAAFTGAKLTLVNVANPAEFMAVAPELVQQGGYEEAAREHGESVLGEALRHAEAAGVKDAAQHLLVSVRGAKEMAAELIDYADKEGSDLLVLGTHGRSGLMHLLMGSFTETVMRQTRVPLLVIRSNPDDEEKAAA